MLLLLRKIIFYLLLPLYFLVAPYAILYALGYIFNPAGRELFKAGLISITTYPKSATVFIGGKRYSKRTPATIRDLLPGIYPVRITRKGYEPWEKEIKVEPEKAAHLDPVVLLPKRPEEEVISNQSYRNFIPEVKDFKIFAWEGESLSTLRKIDLFFKKETLIGAKIPDAEEAALLDFLYKKGSEIVFFKVRHNGKIKFWAYDLNREKRSADLSPWLPEDFQFMDWDSKSADYAYALKKGVLTGFDLRRRNPPVEIAQGVKGFGVKHSRLYILREDATLIQTNKRGQNPKPLFGDTTVTRKIFGRTPAAFYRIERLKGEFFQKDLLLFLSDRGALVSSRLPYYIAAAGVRNFQHAARSGEEKMLFWTGRQIGAVDFTKEATENFFEKGPEQHTFYENGRDIRQAFWACEDSHILFVDEDKVFLLETQTAPYLAREVVRIAPSSGIIYNEGSHTFYYLDAVHRHLIRRRLADS